MLQVIRKSRATKFIAAFLALSMITDVLNPLSAFALSGGPSQPEVQSFEPVGTNQMVDPFTGDFTYNIPLLDVGGYPVNISYHAGVSPEDEASWVGLGWNINVGTINRNLRGLPDDFQNEPIKKEVHSMSMCNVGLAPGIGFEIFGKDLNPDTAITGNLSISLGINYNNYKGISPELGVGLSAAIPLCQKNGNKLNLNLGLGMSNEDLKISPSVSMDTRTAKYENTFIGAGVGFNYSSRNGGMELSYGLTSRVKRLSYVMKNNGIDGKSVSAIKDYKSASTNCSLSFNTPVCSPTYNTPYASTSFSFSFKPGTTFFGGDITGNLSGYYHGQWDRNDTYSVPGYGYLYSGYGDDSEENLLDFSREKDGIYMSTKPNLPLSTMSYDVFSVTGQGVGGVFRPYTNSIGTVYDPKVQNMSVGGSLGVEGSFGNLVHGGVDIKVTYTSSHSGKWSKHNSLNDFAKFYTKGESTSYQSFEPVFFKQVGEPNVDAEPAFYQGLHDRDPLTPILDERGWDTYAESKLGTSANNTFNVAGEDFVRTKRQKRSISMVTLNASQASNFGLEKKIKFFSYSYNGGNPVYTPSEAERIYDKRKAHHISEITTYTPEGMRYVYGIPAYNKTQRDATFSVDAGDLYNSSSESGLVTFDTDDDTHKNRKGRDNFCSATEIPGYAHSFLLTAILSPDYVDYDGTEGPSSGDIGNYTKFSYVKVDNYKWQTPVLENGNTMVANHNEGLKSYSDDDKGSYIKGEKELWYLHQIETRTHIAIFYLSDRYDSKSADDQVSALKLDSIKLFSKNDYELNGEDANVIKAVHFTYDYSLCNQTPNSKENASINPDKGKLTLKEISFSYGKSKYRHNKYTFTYAVDPDYASNSSDRWGGYKPNTGTLSNDEFPYSEQDDALADQYAKAWNLSQIELPSGGIINIEYEADDYAFVMNKRSMQMCKIVGITHDKPVSSFTPGSNNLPLFDGDDANEPNYYLVVAKNGASSINDLMRDQFGEPIKNLYFRGLVNTGKNETNFEWVSAYMNIEEYGNIDDNYMYVKVKSIDLGDPKNSINVNPISKAACQFIRINMGDMIEGYNHDPNALFDDVLPVLGAFGRRIFEFFNGANRTLLSQERAMYVKNNAGFLRLYSPEWEKKGGGHRVKKVTVSDNWESLTSTAEPSMTYGQEFFYTKENPFSYGPSVISSGVASYEPVIGNDENSWREPVNYKNEKKSVADDDYYVEKPIGESVFPAASVGYSQVVVKNLERKNIDNNPDRNVTRHAAGYSVHEFYTSYDFPVRVRQTMKTEKRKSSAPVSGLFGKLLLRDFTTTAQGYSIEIPNMHGRPKSQKEYSETGDLISGSEYYYKTMAEDNNRLDNTVLTVNKAGLVSNQEIGIDMDMSFDSRESVSWALSAGVNGNLATFLIAIFPGLVPTVLPSVSYQKTKFQSLVSTKVINCYPVLDSVVAFDKGSRISTTNELYDSETGQVLVTKTQNEFKDDIYNITYPSHWAYDLMGPLYKNIGAKLGQKIISNGVFQISMNSEESNLLVRGDELGCKSALTGEFIKLWIAKIDGSNVTVIDKYGNTPTGIYDDIFILRSGRRNMQVLPVSQVVCKKSPVSGSGFDVTVDNDVIDASATEFKDRWTTLGQITCSSGPSECADCGYSVQGFVDFMNELIANNAVLTTGISLGNLNGCTYLSNALSCGSSTFSSTEVFTEKNCMELHMTFSDCNGTPYNICPLYNCSSSGFSWADVIGFTAYGSNQVIYQYYDQYNVLQSCTTSVAGQNKPYLCAENSDNNACGFTVGDTINPYCVGILGAWRPHKTYKYIVNRENKLTSTDVRVEGVYDSFSSFWTKNSGNDWTKTTDPKWVCASEAMKYNLAGEEAETRDALFHYSAAVYGFNNKLPIAVAANAMLKEIGYDGFEDIGRGYCSLLHFSFPGATILRSKEQSHTGKYSLRIAPSATTMMSRCFSDSLYSEQSISVFPYSLSAGDISGLFSPHTGKNQKFILSFWVKKSNSSYESDYSNVGISCTGGTLTLQNKSKIIDGWQQMNYLLEIQSFSGGPLVLTVFNNSSVYAYFDDVRVFPTDANMKSFVYDYETLRLNAELDNNNFATFYEYNDEGQLIRIKKETERGIVTLKQSVNHSSR